jgi:hypothetical protein
MAVQIQVSNETWNQLKDLKKRPSQTFDEIISMALSEVKE